MRDRRKMKVVRSFGGKVRGKMKVDRMRMKVVTRSFGGKMIDKVKEDDKRFGGQDDDEDDQKQVEKQGNVVRRQLEDDKRQDEDGKGWANDILEKDEGEKRRELGKGGQRVNLEDFFRRYKQVQGEQQQQQQGGMDRSEWESFGCRGPHHFEKRGTDGSYEQRHEDERERV